MTILYTRHAFLSSGAVNVKQAARRASVAGGVASVGQEFERSHLSETPGQLTYARLPTLMIPRDQLLLEVRKGRSAESPGCVWYNSTRKNTVAPPGIGALSGEKAAKEHWMDPKAVLFVSWQGGLGHITRDLAIVKELRQQNPACHLWWMAHPLACRVLQEAGEPILPESQRSADYNQVALQASASLWIFQQNPAPSLSKALRFAKDRRCQWDGVSGQATGPGDPGSRSYHAGYQVCRGAGRYPLVMDQGGAEEDGVGQHHPVTDRVATEKGGSGGAQRSGI